MNRDFNNAFIAYRKESPLGAQVIEFFCKYPKTESGYSAANRPYCSAIGEPCLWSWWYNHGPQQWAYRQKKGMVIYPLQLFDPANSCEGFEGKQHTLLIQAGMHPLSAAGRVWTIEEVLEFYRGAVSL